MNQITPRLLLFIFFLGVFTSIKSLSFTTLSAAQAYAKASPEYVKPDNKDWLRPDFYSFHKSIMPNLFQRALVRLGWPTKHWDWHNFENLLKQVVAVRDQNGFKGDFAERFKPNKGDKFIIWGDLYSAFHSLVRDLTFLQQQGVVDNNLKIVNPHYYFVFNGNVIEGSPYVLETLTLVLRLMQANPSHVFYTRGYHESEERWHNFELMREFKVRLGQQTGRYTPIFDLLERFFQSLPIALYLTQEKEDEINVVIISSSDRITKLFEERSLAGLLKVKENRGYFKYETSRNDLEKPLHLRAFITGEDRSVSFSVTEGLTLIGAIEGATRWMVFSSPTERNQHLYKFFFDAFAQLDVTNGMSDWTISLYNQQVPELNGFKETARYNLETGRKVREKEQRIKEKEFFFSATMDLSKGASPIGKRVKEGLQLAFSKERAEKTVPGIILQLTTVDDEYTPQKTRAAVEDFMSKNLNMVIGSQGSASLESYLDLIKEGRILVLFPFSGAPLFRKPDLRYLVHYRGSYIREGEELVKYALKDLKAKKIAIFYQDDAFGRGALEGARRALKKVGITNFLEVPHERNVINYKKQIAKIRDYNPDTILFSTNTLAIRGLIRQMGVQYFAGKKLLGLSVYEDAFERFLKDKGLSFILIRMVPDPAISKLRIAKEYRQWADKKNISYDKVSFEQFINANILFEILRKIEGDITKEKIIEVAEGLKDYPFKGLVLDFNPETRELSDTLWIDTGTGEWIKKSTRDGKGKEQLKVVEGEDKRTRFGSLTDLTEGAKFQGQAVKTGIELRLRQAYDNNVLYAPIITIVDDHYNPKITQREIDTFLKEGINIIVCPVGSPTLQAYLDLVKSGRVGVIFPVTGAPLFRNADLEYLVNLRASYPDEAKVLTEYALDQMNARKIGLFYQKDAFGKGLLNASLKVLKSRAIDAKEIPYERNETDFIEQVRIVEEYKPDTLLFFSTSIATQYFIRQLGIEKAAKINMLGNSDFGETKFINFIKDSDLTFIYVNVVPNPVSSTLPIVQQYRDESKKRNVPLDTFSLEAYIGVDILLNVLKSIPQKITKENVIKKLTEIKNKEYKGLMLNFDPQTRTLMHSLWLDIGKPEWQMIQVKKTIQEFEPEEEQETKLDMVPKENNKEL